MRTETNISLHLQKNINRRLYIYTYSKFLPTKYSVYCISEHLLACLRLDLGEAQFKNENEETKERLAFTVALDRSLLGFYLCKTSSSPKSFFTLHKFTSLLRNLCRYLTVICLLHLCAESIFNLSLCGICTNWLRFLQLRRS